MKNKQTKKKPNEKLRDDWFNGDVFTRLTRSVKSKFDKDGMDLNQLRVMFDLIETKKRKYKY